MASVPKTWLRALTLAACATALLGGCADDQAAPGAGRPDDPLVARTPAPAAGSSEGRSNEAASPPESGTADLSGLDEQPGYQKLVERQSRRPSGRFSPCDLVTAAQARAIIRAPVRAPFEAPQGPTCIYRTGAGDRLITVAVQR